ncbi:MAG: tagaturonate epimerase family protein [Opitutales bacterium]
MSEAAIPSPRPLGLKKSFGYGDRLGLAGRGHIRANAKGAFAGIFAQQSIRELDRTKRRAEDVMQAARTALEAAGYRQAWGADADHLKTQADVERTSRAGFTFFTIDPSEDVDNSADRLAEPAIREAVAKLVSDGILAEDWTEAYLGRSFETEDGPELIFDEESLLRAAVKYARATARCEIMAGHIAAANAGRAHEIEVSVDETDSPTSPLEHLFFALELKRRGVKPVSLAPRFIGDFEKGVDYKGDLAAFEAALKEHVAIAKACGPYKISVHSGSDKFSVYPIIGRVCGDLLHVKTAGTSYLEALRVVCRQAPEVFGEIIRYSLTRFSTDRASYHIAAREADFAEAHRLDRSDWERFYLDEDNGRQLLHVTFGSVLTRGTLEDGRTMKAAVTETLEAHPDLHADLLEKHLGRHVTELEAG